MVTWRDFEVSIENENIVISFPTKRLQRKIKQEIEAWGCKEASGKGWQVPNNEENWAKVLEFRDRHNPEAALPDRTPKSPQTDLSEVDDAKTSAGMTIEGFMDLVLSEVNEFIEAKSDLRREIEEKLALKSDYCWVQFERDRIGVAVWLLSALIGSIDESALETLTRETPESGTKRKRRGSSKKSTAPK